MSENSLPLVSIFVISYNGKEFLSQAIESFLAQTYRNIEICISDDASTDGTDKLLFEYKEKLGNKFKYNINQTNLGITKNCNKCLDLCDGEYIAYCGGDDLFLPEKIESQVNAMKDKTDVVASYTDAEIFEDSTNLILGKFSDNHKALYSADIKSVLRNGCFFCACTVMVRKSKIFKFDESLPVASDFYQIIQMLGCNTKYRLVYINKVMSRYRRHASNVTNVTSINSNYLPQNQIDQLNAYFKSIYTYPKCSVEALLGVSRVFRALGKYYNKKYYKIAFQICPWYWKNIIMFLKVSFFNFIKVK